MAIEEEQGFLSLRRECLKEAKASGLVH